MANRSVNKVILVGNLGRDAERNSTPNGIPVTRFSVATSRGWKDPKTNDWKEKTNWTNVVLWRHENVTEISPKASRCMSKAGCKPGVIRTKKAAPFERRK